MKADIKTKVTVTFETDELDYLVALFSKMKRELENCTSPTISTYESTEGVQLQLDLDWLRETKTKLVELRKIARRRL